MLRGHMGGLALNPEVRVYTENDLTPGSENDLEW
jgi:hypothetical protein